jgi:hypothetical protein
MTSGQKLKGSVLAALAIFCASAPAIDTRPPKAPKPSGKTIMVRSTITLSRRNTTYDYEGATLIWNGPGNCGQTENMPPIFLITASGITLKNATIIGAPDGIHVNASRASISDISFPDVCEDAITLKENARWARISNCYFAKAADKAIQGSHGYGHRVYENVFVNVKCAYRSKAGVNASFFRNRLYHCEGAIRADGHGSNTKTWGNTFFFVKHPYVELDRAVIRQLGDDSQVK